MKLVEHWKVVLKMSWAAKLAGAAGTLQMILTTLQVLNIASPWWSLFVVVLAFGAGLARIIQQQRLAFELDKADIAAGE